MPNRKSIWVRTAATFGALAITMAAAAASTHRDFTDAESVRAQRIHKELNLLTNYGVFDSLSFSVEGGKVVLRGEASRPTLKASAERVVRNIEGVDTIVNEIEVLPLSRFDDRIRTLAYAGIYGNSVLSRYNPGRGAPIYWSPVAAMAGITNDPPIGNHPIRIIVNNGNITLEGFVDNESDKAIAGIQANSTPGAFAVTNNLRVLRQAQSD